MAGKLVHFELPVQDVGRAKRFWSGVFGWEFGDSAMPEFEYYMVQTGDDQGGAKTGGGRRAHWIPRVLGSVLEAAV